MSKIILIGDIHLGLGYPNRYDEFLKTHKEYFSEFLIPKLKEIVNPGDIIVQLGDLFDNRSVIPIDLINYTQQIIHEISSIAPLHILIGNHDLWTRSNSDVNSVSVVKYINNVHIYEKPTKIEFNGVNILMMPYFEKKGDQIKVIQENRDCHYLFCHSDLNGAKMHLTSVGHRTQNKIEIDEFSCFRKVYSGHYHIVQEEKNFTFVGNIFQMDRNDINDRKGIWSLDVENDTIEFIENTISPVFRKIYVKEEKDIDRLEDLSKSKDYKDLIISNSLLMGSRKNRRKLENILMNNKFSSIEYLDDIEKENKDEVSNEDVSLIEEKMLSNISIQLDYEEFIKTYIENIEYSSKETKDKILKVYDKIMKIYKDEYKLKG